MTLALILGFLFHLIGDYLTQNNWLAQKKTSYILVATLHGTIYSLPFLFIVGGLPWLIIWSTHIIIDRYRLATYWIQLVNWSWDEPNYGFGEKMPVWLSTWLLFIIDNIFHICINSACIWWYYTWTSL